MTEYQFRTKPNGATVWSPWMDVEVRNVNLGGGDDWTVEFRKKPEPCGRTLFVGVGDHNASYFCTKTGSHSVHSAELPYPPFGLPGGVTWED